MFTQLRSTNAIDSITGDTSVDEVIRTLASDDLARLLRYVRDWNARAKSSAVAQCVLHAILRLRASEDVSTALADAGGGATAVKEMVDALVPYTERHLVRMERLVQESFVVDFILHEMDDGMLEDTESTMDIDTV